MNNVYGKVYLAMLVTMFLRLFWLVVFEPRGAKQMIENHPGDIVGELVYYSVFLSIIVLVFIIIFSLQKRRWAYLLGTILATFHFVLTVPLMIFNYNPGFGPVYVLPVCILMIIFCFLTYKQGGK